MASGGNAGSRVLSAASNVNKVLERLLPLLTPAGLALGLFFPSCFVILKPFTPLIFGIATLSGAIKMKVRDVGATVSRPAPFFLFFIATRIFMPLAVFFLSRLIFDSDLDTISGCILLYAAPTAVSSLIWVSIFRGNTALSLSFILLDTVLAPFAVPGTVRFLLGTAISMDMSGMILSLVYMVVIPTIAGIIMNELSRGEISRIVDPYLAPLAKICLLLVTCANTAAAASQFDFLNSRFWKIALAGIGISVLGFIMGKIAGVLCSVLNRERFGRDIQISLFFGVGLHNISAAMTLGIQFFPPAASVPSIVGIIFQQTICVIMGKLFFREKLQK